MLENLPTGHSWHVVAPTVAEKRPAGQGVHGAEPVALDVPTGQGWAEAWVANPTAPATSSPNTHR